MIYFRCDNINPSMDLFLNIFVVLAFTYDEFSIFWIFKILYVFDGVAFTQLLNGNYLYAYVI